MCSSEIRLVVVSGHSECIVQTVRHLRCGGDCRVSKLVSDVLIDMFNVDRCMDNGGHQLMQFVPRLSVNLQFSIL